MPLGSKNGEAALISASLSLSLSLPIQLPKVFSACQFRSGAPSTSDSDGPRRPIHCYVKFPKTICHPRSWVGIAGIGDGVCDHYCRQSSLISLMRSLKLEPVRAHPPVSGPRAGGPTARWVTAQTRLRKCCPQGNQAV